MNKLKEKNIWSVMQDEIDKSELDEKSKKAILEAMFKMKDQEIDILIAGATGSGKSSTINAMFDVDVANVGYGVNPETMKVKKYELDNLILWDSPGLGDSPQNDLVHCKNIINKLNELDDDGNALIDIALVIIDGSSRDMGTSFELINNVIIPNVRDKNRILIAINQCDIAMKGKGWDNETNKPEDILLNFLDDKVSSVKQRILDSTGVNVKPVYFSALYNYNISKLFSFIVKNTPEEKRILYVNNMNTDPNIWQNSDEIENYNKEIREDIEKSFNDRMGSSLKGAAVGGALGGTIGSVIPVVGTVIGIAVGTVIGAIGGFFGR